MKRKNLLFIVKIFTCLIIFFAFLTEPIITSADIFFKCSHGIAEIINKYREGNGPDQKKITPLSGYKSIGEGIDWTNYNKKGIVSEEDGKRFYCGGSMKLEFWPHLNTGNIEGQCGDYQGESLTISTWFTKSPIKNEKIYMDHCDSSFYIKRIIINRGYIDLSRQVYPNKMPIGPSFSCSRIHDAADLLICASPELSKIDFILSENYSNFISHVTKKGKTEIINHQDDWISKKRKCKSYKCLCSLYKSDAYYLKIQMLKRHFHDSIKYDSLFGNALSGYQFGGCA